MKNKDELTEFIDKTLNSSQYDTIILDEHVSKVDSEIFHHQNDLNKFRLPISTQHFIDFHSVKSKSLLIHLNNQDENESSNQSISTSNSRSKINEYSLAKISEIDSEDQNNTTAITRTEDSDLSTTDFDNKINNELHTPIVLSQNLNIIKQSTKVVLSPLRSTKIEENKTKKLAMSTSIPLKQISSRTIISSKENELTTNHNIHQDLFNEEKFELPTSLIKIENKKSISNSQNISIIDKTEQSKEQFNSNDNPRSLSNSLMQDTNSFNDPNHHTSQKFSKTTESLSNEETNRQSSMTTSITKKNYSQPKIDAEDIESAIVLTPPSSLLSKLSNEQTRRISTPNLNEKTQSSSNNPIEKSYSDESISNLTENRIKNDKSEENISTNSSSQLEISDNDQEHRQQQESSSRIEHLIKLLPSPPTQQFLESDHSENEDSINQIHSSYLIDYENKNKVQLDIQNSLHTEQYLSPMTLHPIANRVNSSSSVMRRNLPMMSTTSTILPSPIITLKSPEHKFKSQLTSFDGKTEKFKMNENQRTTSISSFNLKHLTDLTPEKSHEIQNSKQSSSHSKKTLFDDVLHPIISKQQSSSTNSLIRNGLPSSSIPKLLLKRSSFKPISTTTSSIKPNPILSITDVSISSNNTIATDHLLNTHSTMSDYDEQIALKKVKKKLKTKILEDFLPKFNLLRKSSSLIDSNKEEQLHNISKMKIHANSKTIYETKLKSNKSIKTHENLNKFLIIDKQLQKRTIKQSQQIPFYLKKQKHKNLSIDSFKLPNIKQTCDNNNRRKKTSQKFSHRPIIRLPVTQIEKFECGTIGPHLHHSSLAYQIFSLSSLSHDNQITESFTDRLYSLMSSENNIDKKAFESILHWQEQHLNQRNEQNKFQYMYLLDTTSRNSIRGKQYPILNDEIDLIDDPNACTIVNKWAFADLVNIEREKFTKQSKDYLNKSMKIFHLNKRIQICLRKRPLTEFEENILKEVDIISIIEQQTIFLHIPSITIDNQVFIKNRKFQFDQTFDEHCEISTIYNSTIASLLNKTINGYKCLCLIGGGRFSGKTFLLRSLTDYLTSDLNHFLSLYNISIKLLGICHNRIVDILQNYSSIRLIKSKKWILIPNDRFYLENQNDIDYLTCQIKKRRRFMHQLIQINFYEKNQSKQLGSLMIVILASSQYVYTRNLCSHRRKFLINSLNKTILSFKRALLGIRQNSKRIRTVFNNDILTRLIQPYVFDHRSNICYIGTLNPGHRHRRATKSTLEFARNLRFCFKHLEKKRRQQKIHKK